MAVDTYATIARKLDRLEPFDNKNSMSGRWEGDTFVVYSYRTVIAKASRNGVRWLNSDRYSVTTSRQQALIRRVWEIPA